MIKMEVLEKQPGYRMVRCENPFELIDMLCKNADTLRPLHNYNYVEDKGRKIIFEICTYDFHNRLPKNGKHPQVSKKWRK